MIEALEFRQKDTGINKTRTLKLIIYLQMFIIQMKRFYLTNVGRWNLPGHVTINIGIALV